MINSITLQGFKSFLYREMNLNRLTLLTGLNSSGKSSVIQALLMMEKAFNSEKNIFLDGHGGVKDLKNKYSDADIYLEIEINESKYSVSISEQIKAEPLSGEFPEIWYISASRFGPKNSIPIYIDSNQNNKIGPNGENVLQCIRYYDTIVPYSVPESLKHPKAQSFGLLENVRSWLGVISPNIQFDFEVIDKNDTSFSTFDGHRATNVGFGLSYILPVITTLLVSTISKKNLVIIENPEAHLHPKGQTELAKLIFLCARNGVQVIIETHGEHILDGIRLATKEDGGFSENVQIHWFELDENRNTEVTSPVIDDNGKINEWPNGFFDQFEINNSKLF
ncbi:AAA family ATPase [Pedobacter endophyticus]|uniref:DUF3696 domain-containing protein n=1 Tax=Pedobacter endophyticus TaxID=2789740 RepID=A0A7U3Q552_9SPHI|nr:DUF3696 domain-containing protein [Pedobacter endophyticus]QPH37865.1 DUF3696 domain-containing protein [Pedobacter endophyticus]